VEESKNRQIEFSGILLFGVMIQVKSKYIVIIIKMSTKDFLISQGIKSTSAYVYASYYDKIVKNCFNNVLPDVEDSEVNTKILDFVENEKFTAMTKVNYIKAWIKLNDIKKEGRDVKILEKTLKKLSNETQYKPANDKELEKRVSVNEVIEKRDKYKSKLKSKFSINDVYYLALSFYSYLPPLRSQDYIDTLYKDNDTDLEKDNYYDNELKQLVLNNHKTVMTYGKRIIDIPETLANIIDDFHNKTGSKYLICSSQRTRINQVHFNKILTACIGCGASILRKSYISEKIDEGVTAEERKKTALIMGHSLAVQQLTYSRFSETLHPDNNDFNYLIRRHEQLIKQLKENTNRMYSLIN
jgi:hypothetical protein